MSNTIKKKSGNILVTITNIVCVVLMVAFFASLFLPFWTYTGQNKEDVTAALLGKMDESAIRMETYEISIAEYIWNTEDHEELFGGNWKKMKDFDGNKIAQNDIVSMPFITTLLIAFGVIFCLWKCKSAWTCLFPLSAGIVAVLGYLTKPILQTGDSWVIQLVAAIAMTVGGLVLLAQWAVTIYKWFTVKKY